MIIRDFYVVNEMESVYNVRGSGLQNSTCKN